MFSAEASKGVWPVLLCAIFVGMVFGAEKERVFDISGWGGYEFGQIMKGTGKYGDLNKEWLQRAYGQITVDGKVRERGHCLLSFESMYNFSEPLIDNSDATKKPMNFFYFNEVQGTYAWGDLEKPWLSLAFGYFPYKYNPDARNLGEYLYRSGTYPPYILTNFDFPMTRELGAHVSGRYYPIGALELAGDMLFTTESQHFPPGDFTLALLPGASLLDGFFDIQGGVSLVRLFSINSSRTQPHDSRSCYRIDSTATTDPATGLITTRYDSSFYTFAGTKLMGRFGFDPLKFIKRKADARALFWKEDFKLYGETALLGLKDYPENLGKNFSYDKKTERMPVMLGINLPTYPLAAGLLPGILGMSLERSRNQKTIAGSVLGAAGIIWGLTSWLGDRYLHWNSRIDLIAFEWEYFGWKYPDDYTMAFDDMLPIPADSRFDADYTKDDQKWSLYIRKDFLNVFSLRVQLARDHMRPISNDSKASYKGAVLATPEDWYWMAKISYGF
jgi:hypothetical protein